MRDLVILLTTAAFFAVCVAYVRWCDRIIRVDGPEGADVVEDVDDVDGVTNARDEVPA